MASVNNLFLRYSIAIVTPFLSSKDDINQSIDFNSLESVLNHTCQGLNKLKSKYSTENNIGGIIVSGSTGEQHSMTIDERIALYQASVKFCKSYHIPVAAGVSATTTSNAVILARAAIDAGCQGIMLGLPPYSKLSDPEIKSYILAIHNVVPSNIPILLYNNVARNGYGPTHELIIELYRSNIICGMKYAILPETEYYKNLDILLNIEPNLKLYTGNDRLSLKLMTNTNKPFIYGLTSIIGNLQPYEMGELISNVINNKIDIATFQYDKLSKLMNIILQYSLPTGVKYAMNILNIPSGYCREPLGYLSENDKKLIKNEIDIYFQSIS